MNQNISHISTVTVEDDWIDQSLEDLRKQQEASEEAIRRHRNAQRRLVQELSIISDTSMDSKYSESKRSTPEWHSPKRGSHVSPSYPKPNVPFSPPPNAYT